MENIFRSEMKIFEKIEALKVQYGNDSLLRKNGTLLLGIGTIPKARHTLYKGLDDIVIKKYLIDQYKLPFPKSYANFLNHFNGASLYNIRTIISGVKCVKTNLSIYGLPLTPPQSRAPDMEEPYDVRIESLGQHKDLPDRWLKIGRYTTGYDFKVLCEIFVDTGDGCVYGVKKKTDIIVDKWNNLDDCLCAIFDSFSDLKEEYIYSKD